MSALSLRFSRRAMIVMAWSLPSLWLLAPSGAFAQQAPEWASPLATLDPQDGDTVLFLGDSITHQSLYTQYVEDYFYTRYPGRRIRFYNSGVGGDRARDALVRFAEDVAQWRPKYVTVLLGMNDGSYTRYEQPIFDTYRNDMTTLLDQLHELGAQAIVMTPTMFDSRAARIRQPEGAEVRNQFYSGVLALYGAWLREQAYDRGLGFVDMNTPLNQLTLQQRKQDPAFTMIPDAVHPGPAGQAVMAAAILEDMQVARQVSSINAVASPRGWRVTSGSGAVSDIAQGDALAFTFTANSLPWVLPPEARSGYELAKCGHKLSNERLRVQGLPPGKYRLVIDGVDCGEYTQQQLSFKIELQANEKTPQYQQALEVAMLNKQRNDEAIRPLRNLWGQMKGQRRRIEGLASDAPQKAEREAEFEKFKAEFEAQRQLLAKRAEEFEDRIYEANQPRPRRYALQPISE